MQLPPRPKGTDFDQRSVPAGQRGNFRNGLLFEIEQADDHASPSADVVVASIQTLAPAAVATTAATGPCDAAALGKALAALTESLESGDLDATQQHLAACEQAVADIARS